MEFKDYYEILGVSRKATQKEIQKAFRGLARKWHPDVCTAKNASDKFKEINEANAALKDPEKRRLYDSLGPNWQDGQNFRPPPDFENIRFEFGGPNGGAGGGDVFSDFFNSLFGGGGMGDFEGFSDPSSQGSSPFGRRRAGRKNSARQPDNEAEITVSLEDVYHGSSKSISLQTPDGIKKFNVSIPPGLAEGGKIRLSGRGSPGHPGVRAGNLLLKVHIAKHKRFLVEKHDIYVDLVIASWEAALGAKVDVPTLDGRIKLIVPAGTQGGQKLRLKDKGLRLRGGGRGNLYAVVKIGIPKSLSDKQRRLFEELASVSAYSPREG